MKRTIASIVMLDLALCCVAHALTLVAMQCDARIDSESILMFPALHPCLGPVAKIWLSIFVCPQGNARSRVNIVNQPLHKTKLSAKQIATSHFSQVVILPS